MIVAVDTGGTKTLVAVFNTDGQVVIEHKFPTPKDVAGYIVMLKATINELLDGQMPTCISVALPGNIVDGVMIWAGNLGWHGTDMRALLAADYNCPIIVENDANLAGLAEARALPETPQVCLYLTVSTGIGTGVILNGKIDPLMARTEGGRILLTHNGQPTVWESFASGRSILKEYGKLASEIDDPAVWQQISDNLAQGLFVLLPFLRPDAVVIGGGVGTHFDKFSDSLRRSLHAQLHDGYQPTLTQAVHPEEAVIYGCYYYALDTSAA